MPCNPHSLVPQYRLRHRKDLHEFSTGNNAAAGVADGIKKHL
jgi:hypothetical protein